ncbi:hypothetical protein [Anaeromyxobacter sp. Fw109-5]|uniref:hypothetical protein n=1 Tax=Anaeromyxobacter sp. (strain Fw109-5) TaxID=404589 RepID=UPI000158A64F|nr:hypothetical protein [Anaeromyxobacter sp. Fw109-5]ABS25704.1 hypothetical protein Anae109_1497 [Anaeromyxobacter sp. Fw109-5]
MRPGSERARIGRVLRQRAFAAGFLVTGVLVLAWPFVRAPRFHLLPAFLHLVVAWSAIVVGLAAMARALALGDGDAREGDDQDARRG